MFIFLALPIQEIILFLFYTPFLKNMKNITEFKLFFENLMSGHSKFHMKIIG